MTANSSNALIATYTTSEIRAWSQFIDNTLINGGWLHTSDTGQADLTTIVTASQNAASGYKIYQSDDALTDLFVKMEFGYAYANTGGPAGSTQSCPGLWITIGTGSNGSGTITGTLFARTLLTTYTPNAGVNSNAAAYSFGSAGTSWFNLALWLDLATPLPLVFCLERRKNSSQADVDTGIVVNCIAYRAVNGAYTRSSQCIPLSGSVPAAQSGFPALLSTDNPMQFDGKQQAGLVRPFIGYADPPCLGMALCNSSDLANYATNTLNINSVNHTYRQCGPNITGLRHGHSAETVTRLLLRYE